MPTDQPGNEPAETPSKPRDDATAPEVMRDEQQKAVPGGGGPRGPGAASRSGSLSAPSGAAPNSPVDTQKAQTSSSPGQAGHEAALRAVEADEPEDHPASR